MRPSNLRYAAALASALAFAQGCSDSAGTTTPTPDAAVAVDRPSAMDVVAPPTDTPVSPTDTPVSTTDTSVSPTDTPVSPTDTPVSPTDTPVSPTDTPVVPADSGPPPADAGPPVVGGECTFDAQCLLDEVGQLCDPTLGRCVECNGPRQCPRGQGCNARYQCVPGCASNDDCFNSEYCAADGQCRMGCRNDASCPFQSRPRCDPMSRACVECVSDGQCGAGRVCRGGSCTTGCSATVPCGAGETCCEGMCRNLQGDPSNCGACANRCTAPAGSAPTCTAGSCASACMMGLGNCDGNAANGCETDTRSSVMHCGACGNACPAPAGGAAACNNGRCGMACAAGRADCDGMAANGCEATLDTTTNCGMCGRGCTFTNATGACTAGACAVTACTAGFGNCDNNGANGCETNTQTSAAHCGACGRACSFANASATCASGTCAMGACNAGFADCDGNPANGCEVDTRTSVANCGMCGRACTAANGTPSCAAGVCGVASCAAGFGNCDMNAANGCEASLATSVAHCGACGTACPTNGVCTATGCACPLGYARCGNTCAFLGADRANCGACGTACAAGQFCSGGRCVTDCSSGTTRCGDQCALLGEDRANCGACGNACAADAICAAGRCVTAMSIDAGGCADGTREGFTDRAMFPRIAACSGPWGLAGIFPSIPAAALPACATLGNSSTTAPANGAGCASSNLCAPGWRICNGGDVLPRTTNRGCPAATDLPANTFFAAAVSGTGCGVCALRANSGTANCTIISCQQGCREDGNLNNDFFGCGTMGSTGVAGACDGLNRFSENQCSALPVGGWSCPTMGGESRTVTKSQSAGGGVLCCRD